MKFIISFILTILYVWTPLLGCIGPKTEYQIGFAEVSNEPGKLVVKMKSKFTPLGKNIPEEDSLEYLDDDGYLSAYLTFIKLKKSKAGSLKEEEEKSLLSFMSNQLQVMDRYLDKKKEVLIDGKTIEEKSEAKKIFDNMKTGISEIKTMSDSGKLDIENLGLSFKKIRYWGLESTYSRRKSGEVNWGESLPFRTLNLPSDVTNKAMGCSSEIGDLNIKIQRTEQEKVLPTFGVE